MRGCTVRGRDRGYIPGVVVEIYPHIWGTGIIYFHFPIYTKEKRNEVKKDGTADMTVLRHHLALDILGRAPFVECLLSPG